jgi:transmembrane sensor
VTHDPQPLDDATLVRFLSGEAAPDEVARVEHWLSVSEEHRAELEILKIVWESRPKINADPDDSMWRWISARMRESAAANLESTKPATSLLRSALAPPSRRLLSRPVHQIVAAAGIALFLIGGGTLLLRRVESGRARQPQQSASTMREVVTRRGQRAVLDLADGSRVVLAAGSQLRIPDKFGVPATDRDLYLEGEAYFEVRHDATRPFRVITSVGTVQDIGTEFVVTALPETKGLRVVVAEGSVAIHGRNAKSFAPVMGDPRANREPLLTLRAGEMGFVDSLGLSIQTRRVNVGAYTSWTRGELVYDGTQLREVVPDLMRWYDIDIALADTALAHRRLTATFSDEAPDEMLKLLATALDLRIDRRGRSLTLYPRTRSRLDPGPVRPPATPQPTRSNLESLSAEKAS